MGHTHRLSRFEHALALLTRVEPGDGRTVAVLFSQALVIMVAYYLVRPVREALILTGGGAEKRSYAVGVQALLLIALITIYSLAVQRIGARRVVPALCVFLASHLVLFSCAGRAGLHLAFTFFVWVGLFGVVVVAQFWALATDVHDVRAGQRLLGEIAAGVQRDGEKRRRKRRQDDADRRQIREDREHLDDERRAAEELDIRLAGETQDAERTGAEGEDDERP